MPREGFELLMFAVTSSSVAQLYCLVCWTITWNLMKQTVLEEVGGAKHLVSLKRNSGSSPEGRFVSQEELA